MKTIAIVSEAAGVRINVKVVPGASRDRVMGALGDALKVAVSKPPSGGEANKAVVALLASVLKVKTSQVQIVAGHSNARKQVLIAGVTPQWLAGQLEGLL